MPYGWNASTDLAFGGHSGAFGVLPDGSVIMMESLSVDPPVVQLRDPDTEEWGSITAPAVFAGLRATVGLVMADANRFLAVPTGATDSIGFVNKVSAYNLSAGTWLNYSGIGNQTEAAVAATGFDTANAVLATENDGDAVAGSKYSRHFFVGGGLAASAVDSGVKRKGHTLTWLGPDDGRVIMCGGNDPAGSTALTSGAILSDDATAWSAIAAMSHARKRHEAVLLQDGRLLVAGGQDSSGNAVTSAEIYDPTGDDWSAAGTMVAGRIQGHRLILLPDGRVLCAGGYQAGGTLATAEIFDPATNTWTAASSMSTPRAMFGLVLLSASPIKVLAFAGDNFDGSSHHLLDSSEVWADDGTGVGGIAIGELPTAGVTFELD